MFEPILTCLIITIALIIIVALITVPAAFLLVYLEEPIKKLINKIKFKKEEK